MDSNCGLNKCLFNCFITVIITIAVVIILDIILYTGYAYFSVDKYYSRDIKRWRDRELAKYGAFPGWEEIAPPSETVKSNEIASNSNNLWSLATDGNIYVCQKPCDGTDDAKLWRKYDGKLSKIAASDNGIWGVTGDTNTYSNTTGDWQNKGSWSHQQGVGLVNIAMGPSGWIWGIGKNGTVFRCKSKTQCGRDWQGKSVSYLTVARFGRRFFRVFKSARVQQITVGNTWVWALTERGLYFMRSDGVGTWISLRVPEELKLIAAGLTDNLYAVGVSGKLYKCVGNPIFIQFNRRDPWEVIQGAPANLKGLTVNTDMHGVDNDGLIWSSPLL